jgi:hypothetical protein
MVVSLTDTTRLWNKGKISLIHTYERITDPTDRLTFRKKFKGKYPIIGNSLQSPDEIIGYCSWCNVHVLKFSGWGLRLYYDQSKLFCKFCFSRPEPGWPRFDSYSVLDVVQTLLQ